MFSYAISEEDNHDDDQLIGQKRSHKLICDENDETTDSVSRRNKRARKSTSFGPEFMTYIIENEPRTFQETMSCLESAYWKEAVNSEIESILHNHTWEVVDLPPGNKPLGYKWILKKKLKIRWLD